MGCDSPEGLGFATDPATWNLPLGAQEAKAEEPFCQTRGPEAGWFPRESDGPGMEKQYGPRGQMLFPGARVDQSPWPGWTGHGHLGVYKEATQTPSSLTQAR